MKAFSVFFIVTFFMTAGFCEEKLYPGAELPKLPPGVPKACSGQIVSGHWISKELGDLFLYPDCHSEQNGKTLTWGVNIFKSTDITFAKNGKVVEVCKRKMAYSPDQKAVFLALSCPVSGLQLYSNH